MVIIIKTSEWGDVTGIKLLNHCPSTTNPHAIIGVTSERALKPLNYTEIRPETIAVDIALEMDATDMAGICRQVFDVCWAST